MRAFVIGFSLFFFLFFSLPSESALLLPGIREESGCDAGRVDVDGDATDVDFVVVGENLSAVELSTTDWQSSANSVVVSGFTWNVSVDVVVTMAAGTGEINVATFGARATTICASSGAWKLVSCASFSAGVDELVSCDALGLLRGSPSELCESSS